MSEKLPDIGNQAGQTELRDGWLRATNTIFSSAGKFLIAPGRPGLLDGRWIILLLTCIYFVFVWYWASTRGWVQAWRAVHVPIPVATFVDCRAVLQAVDHYRQGVPIPQIQYGVEPPASDLHWLPMAYPSLWLYLLAPTGLSERDTTVFAISLAVLCLLLTLAFAGRLSPGEGCLYALLLVSPSVMFSVERGNTDLLIYLFLIAACMLLARGGTWVLLAQSIILLMAMLKLYPIAAAASGLKRRGGWGWALLTAGAFAIYGVARRKELHYIAGLVPRWDRISFGARVVFSRLAALTHFTHHRQAMVAAYLAMLVVVLWACRSARHNAIEFPLAQDLKGALFLCGSLIFFINFFIGNVLAYRLRFYLFLLPQFLTWSRAPGRIGRRSSLVLGALIADAYLLGSFRFDWLGDLLCWWILWQLVYLFTATMQPGINKWLTRARLFAANFEQR